MFNKAMDRVFARWLRQQQQEESTSEPVVLDAPVRRVRQANPKVRAARQRQSAMRRRRSKLVGHRRHKPGA